MKPLALAKALLIVTSIIAPLGAHAKPAEGDRASISLGVLITDRDITWGEETYAVNTVVQTDFNLEIYKGAYTYSIVDYAISDNFSIGAGYNYVKIDVDSEDSGLSGSLDWEYKGGMLYLQARY